MMLIIAVSFILGVGLGWLIKPEQDIYSEIVTAIEPIRVYIEESLKDADKSDRSVSNGG